MADFSDLQIQSVWEKATVVDNNDPDLFRKDVCSAWICRSDYGNRDSEWGWEIDHITPVSKGGSNNITNLQPLHWKNNAAKADGRIQCVVISSGIRNIPR